MIPAVEFYLLESTAFAAAIGLLAHFLRKHSAATRHAIFLVAVGKFAVPISLLSLLGAGFGSLFPSSPVLSVIPRQVAELLPAQDAVPGGAASHGSWWALVAALWIGGAAVALARWSRSVLGPIESSASAPPAEAELLARAQRRIGYQRLVVLRVSNSQTEPTLSGILRPKLIIPSFLSERLAEAELESLFLHELAHAKRRDNLSAAFVHTLVCLLWFHPLLRWLEQRLHDERELACDEAVIGCGAPPEIYLAGILKVCGFQFSNAVPGISSVNSSNLKERMEAIMSPSTRTPTPHALRWLVGVFAGAILIAPLAFGFLTSTLRGQAKPVSTMAGRTEQSLITCTFADTKYPEGTVVQQGDGPEQMCVGVLAPLDLNDPDHPRRVPQWIRTNSSIRQRSASVLHLAPPPPMSCKPKPSDSQSFCSCEDSSPFSSGSIVDSERGKLKCDKGKWREATATELNVSH